MIPATLELRELRYAVVEKGRRTKTITVVTTLLDVEQYSKEDIAQLYGFRWHSELDIRSIKQTLVPALVSFQPMKRELRLPVIDRHKSHSIHGPVSEFVEESGWLCQLEDDLGWPFCLCWLRRFHCTETATPETFQQSQTKYHHIPQRIL